MAEGKPTKSSSQGLLYGVLAGMLLGVLLFVFTGNVIWMSLLPLGAAGGLAYDAMRKDES